MTGSMIPNKTLLYAMLMSANKDETAVHVYEALLVVCAYLPLEFRNLLCTNFSQLEFCPRGVLPYMAYTGMCRWTGYGFWPLCPKQGM